MSDERGVLVTALVGVPTGFTQIWVPTRVLEWGCYQERHRGFNECASGSSKALLDCPREMGIAWGGINGL